MELDFLQQLMGGTLDEQPTRDYRGILVVAETRGATLAAVTLEMIGRARELADMLGARVAVALLGESVASLANQACAHGSDTVYVADAPSLTAYDTETYCTLLADLVNENKPEIVLLGATASGRDLAPRLAARLKTGLLAECVALDLDESERLLLGTRAVWNGLMLSTACCPTARPQIATVRPGCLRAAPADPTRQANVEHRQTAVTGAATAVTRERMAASRTHAPLRTARVVVCGGRGMGGAEGFALLDELAALLGGEVAATRAAVEMGWAPRDRMVDITGAAVRPELYVAVATSGAFPHRLAIRGTRCLVAVNSDAQAPIMRRADYAIAGDWREVIPQIIEQIRETERA